MMAKPTHSATPAGICLHQAVGGTEAWHRLSVAFYSRVDRDPRLRPLFAGKTLRCAIDELTAFLAQLFGGPAEDSQHRWWLSLRESHQRFTIGQEERAAWMENMVGALDDVQLAEPLRSALHEFFGNASAHVVNRGVSVPAAQDPGGPPADPVRREIAQCWQSQREIDEVVAAVRAGEGERAVALAGSSLLPARFQRDRSVLTGLLRMMLGSRNQTMAAYLRETIISDPALVRERCAGRTLLHEAAAKGNRAMVELLLRLGADAAANTGAGHKPLYCLANEYTAPDGGEVVRALVNGGADVDACDGVKHCTALHMAARRGNAETAKALLDCGARIEARDSLGDTPLRRAVNCDKVPVAELLLRRGARVDSIGNKGLTPLLAARSAAMKDLLGRRL